MPRTQIKSSIVRDELGHTKGGIYCFFPFAHVDNKDKGVFKIGLATKTYYNRLEAYHTYFPQGVYMIAFLEEPYIPPATRASEVSLLTQYRKIENFILKIIEDEGGERIKSPARVNNEGKTEWVYTNIKTIHRAFLAAEKQYGGTASLYTFQREVNVKPNFVGKVYFPIKYI